MRIPDPLEKYTLRIYERNRKSELIKQKQLYEKCLDEIKNLKMEILEAMIENKNTEKKIEQWAENHRVAVATYNAPIEEMENRIITLKREKEAVDAEQEQRKIKRILEEERRILEMQIKMKKKREREKEKMKKEYRLLNDYKFSKTKLPKLVITKFGGTHFDWLRFWNQFDSQIDKCYLPQVSKFSYLNELVIPKVGLLIDSLPFTSEGYTRVTNILLAKYGKPNEVANAHVQNIMSLP